MYSDTHFHLKHILERGEDMSSVLSSMAARNCMFALDIGTRCDDLSSRLNFADHELEDIEDSLLRTNAKNMLYFSSGIWPAPEAIQNRFEQVRILEQNICKILTQGKKLCALGECGLDHHWNPGGVDDRSEDDFSEMMLKGEAELFEMQLELARKFNLPVIVHSRDAFDGTYSCIKNIGYDQGIIHCYSYGIKEAKAFLDRGWYISFSGSVTYTKKNRMQEIVDLISFVPLDRMLIETDSPYLAPVPFRGQTNTPLLVEHVYRFVCDLLGLPEEKLSLVVDDNIKRLFSLG